MLASVNTRRPAHGSNSQASTIAGEKVKNLDGEDLGKVEDIMIDLQSGRVAYAVLSFGSGFMHKGKLFAIPWASLAVDQGDKKVILNVPRETLETAEGFDKDHWPSMADQRWANGLHDYYSSRPYWSDRGKTLTAMLRSLPSLIIVSTDGIKIASIV